MNNYQLPPFNPHAKTLAKRLEEQQKERRGQTSPADKVHLLPGMRAEAVGIAQETGADVNVILKVMGRGLASGATIEGIKVLARTSQLSSALQDGFSWAEFNELISLAGDDSAFLEHLISAKITPREARKMNPNDSNTMQALNLLTFLS